MKNIKRSLVLLILSLFISISTFNTNAFAAKIVPYDGITPPVVLILPFSGFYKIPPLGGGVTAQVQVGKMIVKFGHGGRHLKGTGLSVEKVNQLIAKDAAKVLLPKGKSYTGVIKIGGKQIEYRAYGLVNNVINIGTYFPK